MLAYESQKKNGWLAALLNFLVPGVGYGYCGRWGLAVVVFLLVVSVSIVTFGVAWPFLALIMFVDGFLAAGRYNKLLAQSLSR